MDKHGLPSELRTFREDMGLSQPRMAQLIGVPVSTFRSWEQGHREPAEGIHRYIGFLMWLHRFHYAAFKDYAELVQGIEL